MIHEALLEGSKGLHATILLGIKLSEEINGRKVLIRVTWVLLEGPFEVVSSPLEGVLNLVREVL